MRAHQISDEFLIQLTIIGINKILIIVSVQTIIMVPRHDFSYDLI